MEPPTLTCPSAITVQCVYSGQDTLFDHADPEFGHNCGLHSPSTGTWKSTTPLGVSRYKHTATSLDAYTVLLVGGASNTHQSAVELFKVNAQ